MTPSKPIPCRFCGKPFYQYNDGKGTPQVYCNRICKGAAKRIRNLANRKARGIDVSRSEYKMQLQKEVK
jgi:hypothetical protein